MLATILNGSSTVCQTILCLSTFRFYSKWFRDTPDYGLMQTGHHERGKSMMFWWTKTVTTMWYEEIMYNIRESNSVCYCNWFVRKTLFFYPNRALRLTSNNNIRRVTVKSSQLFVRTFEIYNLLSYEKDVLYFCIVVTISLKIYQKLITVG